MHGHHDDGRVHPMHRHQCNLYLKLLHAEGRIEPSDGTLMCSYHGWRFSGEGKCTDVPQSLDAKANAAACANPRSCARSHPTKVFDATSCLPETKYAQQCPKGLRPPNAHHIWPCS